jgi:tetratricopeptide (TPR) repeat protein
MEGRSAASIAAAREIAKHGDHMKLGEAERLAPLLSMVLVRFGKWDEVLAQPIPAKDRRYETAISHHARGLALSATGKPAEAAQELAGLQAIAQSPEAKSMDSLILPASTLVSIAAHDLAGHVALKAGDHDRAIAELTEAVKLEDALPYMEPPFAYMPTRHALGAALLAAGRPKDAERVYREDLKRLPNNGWSLYGLSQAMAAQGKPDAADAVRRQYEQAWIRADVKITSSRY